MSKMKVVFNREDFTLCSVPVPYGYPQSQTHTGVGVLNGRFILSSSPYPHPRLSKFNLYSKVILKKLTRGRVNLLYRGEDYENPCVYIGVGDEIYPTQFKLLRGSPLMSKPFNYDGLRSYCSDPDLFIEGDKVYLINRTSVKNVDGAYTTKIYLIESSIQNDCIESNRVDLLFIGDDMSPCITKLHDDYYYFALETNSYNDGTPCDSLFFRKGASLRSLGEKNIVTIQKGAFDPWHMSVFQYNGKLFSVVACIKDGVEGRCFQMLGEFNDDLSEMKIYQTPITDLMSYRGAIIVHGDEIVLYSTTVDEYFPGDVSVDGRNVVMAHLPTKEFFSRIRDMK